MGDSVVCGSLWLVFLFSQCTHPYWPVGEEVERFQLWRCYWYFAVVSWGQKGMCNHNMKLCKVRQIGESLWSLYSGVTIVSWYFLLTRKFSCVAKVAILINYGKVLKHIHLEMYHSDGPASCSGCWPFNSCPPLPPTDGPSGDIVGARLPIAGGLAASQTATLQYGGGSGDSWVEGLDGCGRARGLGCTGRVG